MKREEIESKVEEEMKMKRKEIESKLEEEMKKTTRNEQGISRRNRTPT